MKKMYFPLLTAYLKNKRAQRAIDLFFTIDKPDPVAYFLFFNACAQLANSDTLALGQRVFSQMPKKHQEIKTSYAVLDMFIRCEDLESAENLFHQLKKDVICYSSMMRLYNQRHQPERVYLSSNK
jgi:PPR repeat